MSKASQVLRAVYAICLAGATCNHVIIHVRFGLLLGALERSGYQLGTRMFWSALTLLDPLAALLLFIRPRVGLILTIGIIVCDVAHNSWIVHHFGGAPDAAYCAQVCFLLFVAATLPLAWPGVPPHSQTA